MSGDTTCRVPSYQLWNTVMMPVPTRSAAVTASPPKVVSARVFPLRVKRTGSVPVVPVGIASAILMVMYPISGILRNPRAKSTASVPTETLLVLTKGMPDVLVVMDTAPNMAFPPRFRS